MGEARRRKHRSGNTPWQGPLPAALFLRLPNPTSDTALHGNMHLLEPPADDEQIMRLASKLANQLMAPDGITMGGVRPLWRDPDQSWHYGLATTLEIKRKVRDSRSVINVQMIDRERTCHFLYQQHADETACELNRCLSDGLLPLRPGG